MNWGYHHFRKHPYIECLGNDSIDRIFSDPSLTTCTFLEVKVLKLRPRNSHRFKTRFWKKFGSRDFAGEQKMGKKTQVFSIKTLFKHDSFFAQIWSYHPSGWQLVWQSKLVTLFFEDVVKMVQHRKTHLPGMEINKGYVIYFWCICKLAFPRIHGWWTNSRPFVEGPGEFWQPHVAGLLSTRWIQRQQPEISHATWWVRSEETKVLRLRRFLKWSH